MKQGKNKVHFQPPPTPGDVMELPTEFEIIRNVEVEPEEEHQDLRDRPDTQHQGSAQHPPSDSKRVRRLIVKLPIQTTNAELERGAYRIQDGQEQEASLGRGHRKRRPTKR